MKNLSVVLNVILLIAVAVLYYLHCSGGSRAEAVSTGTDSGHALPIAPAGSIVFVNSDSLVDNYHFFKKQKADFDSHQERVRSELKSENNKLQSEVEDYQAKAAGMTPAQRQQEEERLGMKQQKLMQRKEELMSELDDEQSKSTNELYTRLTAYLKKFNTGKNYHFV